MYAQKSPKLYNAPLVTNVTFYVKKGGSLHAKKVLKKKHLLYTQYTKDIDVKGK